MCFWLGLGLILFSVFIPQLRANPFHQTLVFWQWANLSGAPLEVPVLWDWESALFAMTVGIITLAVFFFSLSYMSEETYFFRFHILVLSFVGSMMVLVFSPSMISLLLGWDGLGITSFLLVTYFQNNKSLGAGFLTALSNRVGDCLLLISIAMVSTEMLWSPILPSPWTPPAPLLSLLILSAALTKSAQIPFSAWLPAAMAAPTPVSSLVHSSTLVTAGVYLLCRYGQWALTPLLEDALLSIGLATSLLAGSSALYETDMKKIVALSTLSQLGMMMSALGLSLYNLAFFHLLTHAFFKALLFITVGNLIHLSNGFQDSRVIGLNLWVSSPTLGFSLLANFSLMGLPFLAGFYSKDLLIESSLLGNHPLASVFFLLLTVGVTAAYTTRLLVKVIMGFPRGPKTLWSEDLSLSLHVSYFALAPLATGVGAAISWLIFPKVTVNILPWGLKICTLCFIAVGTALGGLWGPSYKTNLMASFGYGWESLWSLPSTSTLIFAELPQELSANVRNWDLTWVSVFILLFPRMALQGAPWSVPLPSSKPFEFLLIAFVASLLFMW